MLFEILNNHGKYFSTWATMAAYLLNSAFFLSQNLFCRAATFALLSFLISKKIWFGNSRQVCFEWCFDLRFWFFGEFILILQSRFTIFVINVFNYSTAYFLLTLVGQYGMEVFVDELGKNNVDIDLRTLSQHNSYILDSHKELYSDMAECVNKQFKTSSTAILVNLNICLMPVAQK